MFIDTHVHCRDEEQSGKETIEHALSVARDSGVNAIFDMPNTQRPVFNEERVRQRLQLAKYANVPEVFYGAFLGLTNDREQIKQAVDIHRKIFPYVVGMKLYAGHSTGNLGVIKEEDQRIVYRTLSQEGYSGVLFVHAEKESEMNDNIGIKFNPNFPISHCLARPPKAELESVKDQIRFAQEEKFAGKLHIAHISYIGSVLEVKKAKLSGMDISAGVCPHHLMLDESQMFGESGILFKMNPPLRNKENTILMYEALKSGDIDWIETDHAPHTLEEKTRSGFLSGLPGLPWWPLTQEYLRMKGMSDKEVEKVTFSSIAKRFGIDISPKKNSIKDRRSEYAFNPYKEIEEMLSKRIGYH